MNRFPVMQKQLTVGWKVSTLNPSLASLRYRALFPLVALESQDITGKIIARYHPTFLNGIDVLVIVKSFTLEDYSLAQQAVKRRIPVIFDLCDNIFIEEYKSKKHPPPSDMLTLIAGIASAIVVTTTPLAEVIQQHLGPRIPVFIVPDSLETPNLLTESLRRLRTPQLQEAIRRFILEGGMANWVRVGRDKIRMLQSTSLTGLSRRALNTAVNKSRHLPASAVKRYGNWRHWVKLAYRHYDQVRAKVTRTSPRTTVKTRTLPKSKPLGKMSDNRKTILWFGNHGATHAAFGMLDILLVREALETLAAEMPIELLVVSNHADKFAKHIRPLAIPTRYVEWNGSDMEQHLRKADVVIVPNSLDAFSICKSSNRTVLSLSQGTPVVATATPALMELRTCIELDDFVGGLRRYLTDPVRARNHVERAQDLIEKLYGRETIAKLWTNVLKTAISNTKQNEPGSQPELIVAMHLPQDIDLARPLLAAAEQQGLRCEIWSNIAAFRRWPQLATWVRESDYNWSIFPDDLHGFDASIFPPSVRALLSITETTLNPHRFAHRLTKLANMAKIFTATIQHGFENVGLTYSDEVQDIQTVLFASRRIYTWGHQETLHEKIPAQTKSKCYPVGCPKPAKVPAHTIPGWAAEETPVIGIFENLHWHRYPEEYREFFMDSVRALAEAFPNIDFIVKPHNAGMWLTTRYGGPPPELENLIIADPQSPEWTGCTAPNLFGHLQAVITTPSTVALDAARCGLPTAIVAHTLDLKNYLPLDQIRSPDDWKDFVCNAMDASRRSGLIAHSSSYVDRVLIPGDAALRIINDLMHRKRD